MITKVSEELENRIYMEEYLNNLIGEKNMAKGDNNFQVGWIFSDDSEFISQFSWIKNKLHSLIFF